MNSKDPYDFQTLDTSGINQVQVLMVEETGVSGENH
jgi:hypothetical protein